MDICQNATDAIKCWCVHIQAFIFSLVGSGKLGSPVLLSFNKVFIT
ncbi:hypothetical protein M565_ctg5P0850 [Vibrio cyclitrophicus FF75]|nr:hypothetical protein M565_ctg5P0850 [Vibrio cyclitrophicus FF75]